MENTYNHRITTQRNFTYNNQIFCCWTKKKAQQKIYQQRIIKKQNI